MSTQYCAARVVVHTGKTMKTNVTLKLDADLLREARVLAAEEGTSISAMPADRVEARVEDLWRSRSGVVSTQVLQELSVSVRKKAAHPLDLHATRDLVSDYLAWHVVVNDGDAVLAALDLEDRYKVSFWDALIIHAAQAADAELLYSEDLLDGQRYDAVRVVNPLVG